MQFKLNFFRFIAIPACIIGGIVETVALQRSRLINRRQQLPGVTPFIR
jgi:hypothetical protein